MMNYVVYDRNGKILRTGICSEQDFELQAKDVAEEFVREGVANDLTQKISEGKVVDKTQAEIDADKPPRIKLEDMSANITNKQWQDMQDRITQLENN